MNREYLHGYALAKKSKGKVQILETPYGLGDFVPVLAEGTTKPRMLKDRFADVVNVKDFGAVGDGVHDDSIAFSKAIVKSKTVFVPEGVYAVNSTSDFISHCYGFGSLKYSTGLITSVRFLAEDKALKQFYNCDLKGFRTNSVAQSMSILDGFIFISQNTDPSDDAFGVF